MADIKQEVQKLFSLADIKINGKRPWDIKIHNEKFYGRVLSQGSLGLGESYMDGWWDCNQLDEFFNKILLARLDQKVAPLPILFHALKFKLLNLQTKRGARKVAEKHYDLSHELYMSFLDPYNQYTCGYFKNTDDLNKAQEQKLDLICKKLQLKKTDKVLDIGCGWGGFSKFAAERYGCHVTGITISDEQAEYAKKFCKGLPVTIKKIDYRDLDEKFDKILICGMIEHVGHKNYKKIVEVVHRSLNDNGLFLLHTIGANDTTNAPEPWLEKYIFPNSEVPNINYLVEAFDKLFVLEDWHNFGAYYDPTLMAWFKSFDKNWKKLKAQYDERFYRMFKYYFLCCAGSFRARTNQLWQIVLSKNGVPGGYQSVR
jgi:cyclopropane-fatty-acyl-phospholipid synthase